MVDFLINVIRSITQFYILIVIASVLLSYIISPYHPVKEFLDRFVEPLLMPIRRVVPLIGMFDFSPLILILLVNILSSALVNFLITLR